MARFHLCWELGGGLGHAGRLKVLAEALLARGHDVSISLRDLAQTHGLFAGLRGPSQGPAQHRSRDPVQGPAQDPAQGRAQGPPRDSVQPRSSLAGAQASGPATPAAGPADPAPLAGAASALPLLQAPVWLHRTEGMPPNHASHAEILLTAGYLQAGPLAGMVDGWRSMFSLLRPDVVVGDYAPTAMLAARSMGLRSASVGSAFSMPPAGRPLPCLRAWENVPPQRLAAAEQRVLHSANSVLAQHGAPPLAWAAELLLGDVPLLTTWPELDQFDRASAQPDVQADWYGPAFLPAGGEPPAWPAGDGAKVFAYLRAGHADHAGVLAALAQEGCRVLCYLPEVAGGRPPPVTAPNLAYAAGPVALQAALAEAQLCVTHGGEATLAQSMLAGVPVLMLPMQLEQFLTARRIAAAGMGVNAAMLSKPQDWHGVVRHMLSTPGYGAAVQAFARRNRNYDVAEMAARVASALEVLACRAQ